MSDNRRGSFNRDSRDSGDRFDNRSEPRSESRRVTHIYDSRCHGTLARNNRDETLVGVIWDERPGVLHPCLREEIRFQDTGEREDRRPRGRNDRDSRNGRGSDRGGFRRNRDDDETFVAGA